MARHGAGCGAYLLMSSELRDRARGFYSDLIGEKAGRKLERHTYNWAVKRAAELNVPRFWESKDFRTVYCDKARSIRFNLKNKANPAFVKNVQDGVIDLKTIPDMKPWEIFPQHWVAVFDEVAKMQLNRDNSTIKLPDDYKSQVQCRKCKAYKLTWVEFQLRAADEPATIFFHCNQCGNRFKG